jgi:hypothetical protein
MPLPANFILLYVQTKDPLNAFTASDRKPTGGALECVTIYLFTVYLTTLSVAQIM